MANVKLCDRCGEQFSGWRAVTREYLVHRDVLRNSTTPTVRHKPIDLCGDCNRGLEEWLDGPQEAINDD